MLLATVAQAQRLNLDETPAPAAGSGASALSLADELDLEIAAIGKSSPVLPLDQARVALRRLARDLLKTGDQDGTAGSIRVLTGRTIASRRAALDECLRAPGVDGPMLEALSRDLTIAPGTIPTDPGALDRLLRDAFAPVAQHVTIAPPAGWVSAETPAGAVAKPRPLGDAARAGGLSREGVDAFEALDSRLALAEQWTVYKAQAGMVRSIVEHAAGVWTMDKLEWMTDQASARLRAELVGSVGELAKGGDAVELVRALRKLAAYSGAAAGTQKLDSGRAARALRTALGEVVTSPAWVSDPGLTARLNMLGKQARVLTAPGAPDDKTMIRQLRPALRALEPPVRQSAAQLLETLARLVKQGDALSDPAVLGAITAHERRLADVAMLKEISTAVADPSATGEPVAKTSLKALADRLLTLGQDLGKADTRDVALTELRDLAQQVRDYREMPGEKELRAGTQAAAPEWAALGDRIGDVPAAIDQARAAWLAERSTAKGAVPPQKAHHLAVLRNAVRLLADCAAVRRVIERTDGGAANAWPGWEMSREALAVVTGGMFDKASKLVGQLLAGQDDDAEKSIDLIREQHSAAVLLGRLEGRAESLGLRPQESASADAIAQLALGSPDPDAAWVAMLGIDLRLELASVCRYAEESSFAQAKKDNAKAQFFRGYYNARARVVLERVSADR